MSTHADPRTYVGRLEAGAQAVYVVDDGGVARLKDAESFGWGADSPTAPAALARVLLWDATGADPDPDACKRFARQVLSRLPHDGFTLPREAVSAWMQRAVAV